MIEYYGIDETRKYNSIISIAYIYKHEDMKSKRRMNICKVNEHNAV